MNIGSLCSGYGGLDMGLMSVLGGQVAWHVEYEAAPSKILAHHWPDVPNYGDLTTTDWRKVEPVDWLTAGYPCQPFSHAGKRKGTADARHLWPHVGRAISALRPRNVLLENVAGHLTLGFADVLGDLATLGYDATWGVVRASDAGAPHQRARLFVVATDTCGERHGRREDSGSLDSLDSRDESEAREREWSRQEPGDRGPVGDAHGLAGAQRSALQRRPGTVDEPGTVERALGSGGIHPAPDAEHSKLTRVGDSAGPSGRPDRSALTSTDTDEVRRGANVQNLRLRQSDTDWGDYRPAIERWEHVTGRRAPAPTELATKGGQRLAPVFVEWMQGLPVGHVTDIDISRNDKLKALGNGVVPQQCALAVTTLLPLAALEVAA